MLTLEDCKRILEKDGAHYSDEEVLKIRELLYKLAELDLELFKMIEDGGPKKVPSSPPKPKKRIKKKKSKK